MSKFSFISKMFGGHQSLSTEDQGKLYEELLLLTLSRASRSDLDISAVEIAKIQQILSDSAGVEASEQDIRTAGMSELYETAPLEKYVAKAAKSLTVAQRRGLVGALYEVVGADGVFGHHEADFFDSIAKALSLRPIEMMGASIDGVRR